jgi:hypothetical protein
MTVTGKVHVNSSSACGINLIAPGLKIQAEQTSVVGGACYQEGTISGPVVGGADVIPDPVANLLPDSEWVLSIHSAPSWQDAVANRRGNRAMEGRFGVVGDDRISADGAGRFSSWYPGSPLAAWWTATRDSQASSPRSLGGE